MVLAIVVLAIVVLLFCVLGSVASYRCVRHHYAILSPSELVSTTLPKSSLSCVLISGSSRETFNLYGLSSIKSSSNSSAVSQEERIPLGGLG